MNNVDYVVICANQGVNKCNLLVHPDPGLNLPVRSLNFVDPSTGAHTQSIESIWIQTKRMMRVMNTSSSLFPTNLQEFLWRKKFATDDRFLKILDNIQEQYPLP